ncbi:MAG: DnaJ-domain-containing protein 1 [Phycisphaerales bacterium]|jgi:DnaJ-domain-containing protein 1
MPDPQPNRDPFALLGLPRSFRLTRADIESAYLQRAASLHPDLSGEKADEAARASSDLNHAKQALLDPETRANALLALIGGAGKSEDKSLPDGFLMEIMEIRQQIEADLAVGGEGGKGGVGGVDESKRAQWEAWAESRRADLIERVGELFDAASQGRQALPRIRTQLNAWRYTERLIEQLDPDYDPAQADFR